GFCRPDNAGRTRAFPAPVVSSPGRRRIARTDHERTPGFREGDANHTSTKTYGTVVGGAFVAVQRHTAPSAGSPPVRRADDGLDRSALPLLPAPDRAAGAAVHRNGHDRGDSVRRARALLALRSGGASRGPAARRGRSGP